MASATIYATVPAVVVAAGIYFFDKNHYKPKVTQPLYLFYDISKHFKSACNFKFYLLVYLIKLSYVIYFYIQEHQGGVEATIQNMVTKTKEEVKRIGMPKLAPQFDGLHCFETLVGRSN